MKKSMMFTLAEKFAFKPNPRMCFLAASAGYSDSTQLSWNLKLQSLPAHTALIPPKQRGPGWDTVAFGVDCRGLAFSVSNWTELAERTFEVPENSLSCAFSVFEWDDLISLNLKFGKIRANEIEVFAEGVGAPESLQELLPNCKASFSIHTFARFLGVSIQVPVNANDYDAYARQQINKLLPGFTYGQPIIRRAENDAGQLRGVEAFCAPL
jgi:hypothetical protein